MLTPAMTEMMEAVFLCSLKVKLASGNAHSDLSQGVEKRYDVPD